VSVLANLIYSRISIFQYFKNESESDFHLKWNVEVVILCVRRLPGEGTPLPKRVAIVTYHELCFMIYILLYFY